MQSESLQGKSEVTNVLSSESHEVLNAPKRTYLQELNPLPKIDRTQNYLLLLFRPLPVILYPATIFTTLAMASSLGWYLAALTTNASVFQAPPYNMSASINGLINIPGIIGTIIGGYCGGGLTDKLVEKLARRNGGIFEPEMRLVGLIIPTLVLPAGLLM